MGHRTSTQASESADAPLGGERYRGSIMMHTRIPHLVYANMTKLELAESHAIDFNDNFHIPMPFALKGDFRLNS